VFDRNIGSGDGGRQRDVDRAVALRRGTGEIQGQFIALDFQRDADCQRLIGDAVIVEKVFRFPAPIR
jgi:hypothetical protein